MVPFHAPSLFRFLAILVATAIDPPFDGSAQHPGHEPDGSETSGAAHYLDAIGYQFKNIMYDKTRYKNYTNLSKINSQYLYKSYTRGDAHGRDVLTRRFEEQSSRNGGTVDGDAEDVPPETEELTHTDSTGALGPLPSSRTIYSTTGGFIYGGTAGGGTTGVLPTTTGWPAAVPQAAGSGTTTSWPAAMPQAAGSGTDRQAGGDAAGCWEWPAWGLSPVLGPACGGCG